MQIWVKPAGALPVLREDNSFFAGGKWEAVESTHYIRRRIAAGDLAVRQTAPAAKAAATAQRKDEEGKSDV